MSFEDKIIAKIDKDHRVPDRHPVIRESHALAVRLLERDSLDPHDFEDLYGKENIQKDLNQVETLKGRFEENETKHTAEVLEAILYEQIELNDWLGSNAETIKTSEYDDIINGVDLIIEFTDDDASSSHLALGVDITFGSKSMEKKFDRIKKEIDADQLAKVKYFESHGFKGSLQQLPRAIVGVDKETIKGLAGLWMQQKKNELAQHWVRDVILFEIENQLRTFNEYALRKGSDGAVKSFTRALNVLKNIEIDPKRYSRTTRKTELELLVADQVFRSIMTQLERFK